MWNVFAEKAARLTTKSRPLQVPHPRQSVRHRCKFEPSTQKLVMEPHEKAAAAAVMNYTVENRSLGAKFCKLNAIKIDDGRHPPAPCAKPLLPLRPQQSS